MNNFTTVEAFLEPFTSKRATLKPEDFPALDMETFARVSEMVVRSFPDIHFQYKGIHESPTDPNLIVVDGFYCTATHTGAPYTFAPGVLPAIPTTGIAIRNDEENLYFTMVDGKIDAIALVAYGCLTGPAGLYEQIGGDLSLMKGE